MAGRGGASAPGYKTPIVLGRIRAEVAEPYRTFLLVHANIRMSRDALAAVQIGEVYVSEVGIYLRDVKLGTKVVADFQYYLRSYLAGVETIFLFPLPSNPGKGLNSVVAKRKVAAIVRGS